MSLADGAVISNLPPDTARYTVVGSDSGGTSYAAWGSSTVPRWVFTQGLSDPEPLAGARSYADYAEAVAAVRGYVWLDRGGGSGIYATDRTGAARSERLPGHPQFINKDFVVTDGGPGSPTGIVIWRLTD